MFSNGTYYFPVCVAREEYEKKKSDEFITFIEYLISLHDPKLDDIARGEWTVSIGEVAITLEKTRDGYDWRELIDTKKLKIELKDCTVVHKQKIESDKAVQDVIYIYDRNGQKFTYEGKLSDHTGILDTIVDIIFRAQM